MKRLFASLICFAAMIAGTSYAVLPPGDVTGDIEAVDLYSYYKGERYFAIFFTNVSGRYSGNCVTENDKAPGSKKDDAGHPKVVIQS